MDATSSRPVPAFLQSPLGMMLDGQLMPSEGGRMLDVENPATGRTVTQVPEGTAADVDRAVLVDEDFDEAARLRRRDLGVHLVGRDLKERLVHLDEVADRLLPLQDRPFHHGLAHFGHYDVYTGHDGGGGSSGWTRVGEDTRAVSGRSGLRRRAAGLSLERARRRGSSRVRGRPS